MSHVLESEEKQEMPHSSQMWRLWLLCKARLCYQLTQWPWTCNLVLKWAQDLINKDESPSLPLSLCSPVPLHLSLRVCACAHCTHDLWSKLADVFICCSRSARSLCGCHKVCDRSLTRPLAVVGPLSGRLIESDATHTGARLAKGWLHDSLRCISPGDGVPSRPELAFSRLWPLAVAITPTNCSTTVGTKKL